MPTELSDLSGSHPRGARGVGRRADVLGVLKQSADPLGVVDIAERLGLHPNTARFHLENLEAEGQVERVPDLSRTPGRPRLLFRAVPGMDPTGPRSYGLLAQVLVDTLGNGPDTRRRAVAAGRSFWKNHPARRREVETRREGDDVDRLIAVLDDLGFAPERRHGRGGTQIGLRHCPFLEVATSSPGVVCPIHLGLMQGALEEWESPVTIDRLEEFVEPDLCLAHVAVAEATG